MYIDSLNHYLVKLTSLNQSGRRENPAPHKPILLLALIDYVAETKVTENYIHIDNRLLELYKHNWEAYVKGNNYRSQIEAPLYHLQNDKFWTAYLLNGDKLDKSRGISKISHGTFAKDFFQLIASINYRPIIRTIIIEHYFSDAQPQTELHEREQPSYFTEYQQMITDPSAKRAYIRTIKECEGFVRSYIFRKKLLPLYKNQCCISGISTTPDIWLVEACHIEPFSESGNNHLTNGIPLCRNLHRYFDAGLISIDKQYHVIAKSDLIETPSIFNITPLIGSQIQLPTQVSYYPNQKYLEQHRKEHGFS